MQHLISNLSSWFRTLISTHSHSSSSSSIISPLLNEGLPQFPPITILCQATPANFSISSFRLVSGLFLFRYSLYECQSVSLFVHLLSFILATWPAHLRSCCFTTCTISFTLVFFSDPGRSFPVLQCYSWHGSFHGSLCHPEQIFGLLRQFPCLIAVCHGWYYALIICFVFQAYGHFALKYVSILAECHPTDRLGALSLLYYK